MILIAGAIGASALPMSGTFTLHDDGQTMQPIAWSGEFKPPAQASRH